MTTQTAPTPTTGRAPRWAGALSGFFSAAVALALGTLIANLLTGVPTPIESVGNRAIDFAPPFLKDFAVNQFGTNDKPVLIGGVVVTLAIVAALAGAIGVTKPRIAVGAMAALGVIAFFAALFDRTATANRIVVLIPTLITAVVAVVTITFLLRRMGVITGEAGSTDGFQRRAFLLGALGVAAVAVIGGGLSRVFGGAAAKESRANITLPKATTPETAIPAGVEVGVDGVSKYITRTATSTASTPR